MRVVFAGTPEFAVPSLRMLLEQRAASRLTLVAVYTQPDRPAGRGRRLSASAVKRFALEHRVPVEQPHSLKDPAAQRRLRELAPDLLIVVAYGLLLPPAVIEIPSLACVNVHGSLLPRWRGAAPIQRAILAGDDETGVSIMRMTAGLDEGPVYLARRVPIDRDLTASQLHDRLALLGAEALADALPGIIDGSLRAKEQQNERACYATKIDKDEARLDFSLPAGQLARQVRAFNSWPVAWCRLQFPTGDATTVRIWQASHDDTAGDSADPPGTISRDHGQHIRVQTGHGLLTLERLQLPGRRPVTAAEFRQARDLSGACFT